MKIEKCVFCKSEKVEVYAGVGIDEKTRKQTNFWYVYCNNCLARGSVKSTKEEAINIWNKSSK